MRTQSRADCPRCSWVDGCGCSPAAAQADFTVLLLSEDAGKKIGALAPLELLDALNALVERSKQPIERPILLEARYAAKASEGTVDFDADFVIYCPSQGPTDYLLPLGSTELREALCDKQPAFPMAAPAGQTGYLFRMNGAGRHHLRLRFAVAMNVVGLERSCRTTIPVTALLGWIFRLRRVAGVFRPCSRQVHSR